MSRLERHRQKKIKIYIAILAGLFIFFFFFGLPLFINSSLFLSNLFGGGRDEEVNQSQTFREVQISDIPEATNSASFMVSGNLNNFDSLEFYLNGDRVKSIKVGGKDSFSEELSGLEPGENDFYVIAKVNRSSESKKTSTYKISYKNSKPKLEISEPADNLKTNRTEIKVAGSTDVDSEIRVNGNPVVVDPNGNFQTLVRLNNGDNKIALTADDIAGNREEKTLTVNSSPDN